VAGKVLTKPVVIPELRSVRRRRHNGGRRFTDRDRTSADFTISLVLSRAAVGIRKHRGTTGRDRAGRGERLHTADGDCSPVLLRPATVAAPPRARRRSPVRTRSRCATAGSTGIIIIIIFQLFYGRRRLRHDHQTNSCSLMPPPMLLLRRRKTIVPGRTRHIIIIILLYY